MLLMMFPKKGGPFSDDVTRFVFLCVPLFFLFWFCDDQEGTRYDILPSWLTFALLGLSLRVVGRPGGVS